MTGEIACGSALSSSLTRSTTIALWDAVQDGSPGCHSEYPTVPSSERCTSAETTPDASAVTDRRVGIAQKASFMQSPTNT